MSVSLFRSSGDLTADRRFDYARDLESRGDLVAAADLMQQAIERAPRFASAWFALGELRLRLDQNASAIEAFRHAIACDPEDHHGAALQLMALGVEPAHEMPRAYVQSLFDQYAPKFDTALRDDLGYRGPEILLQAVMAAQHRFGRPAPLTAMIDLGCGTGLAARAFEPMAERIVGVDLSPAMLARADTTGLYDKLVAADMLEGLRAEPDSSFDLVLAADALVYVRDLGPIMIETRRVLRSNGLFAATVETHPGPDVILGDTLRFRHGEIAIREALARAKLAPLSIAPVSTRVERGEPVPGLVVIAEPGER